MITKNRNREKFSFANINLLGKCNVDCYFYLGKDIHDLLSVHDQTKEFYLNWKNFARYIRMCKKQNIKNLYITGQNTDSLLYNHLGNLINYLQHIHGFDVGIRTNGFLSLKHIKTMNLCRWNVGLSIHTLNPET